MEYKIDTAFDIGDWVEEIHTHVPAQVEEIIVDTRIRGGNTVCFDVSPQYRIRYKGSYTGTFYEGDLASCKKPGELT